MDIDPDRTMNQLTGANATGKTSVLDTIAMTLSGDVLKTISEPLRHGTEKGVGQVILGDPEPPLTVTRTFTANDKSYLKVESEDGARYPSPQKMLDAMIGKLTFDPLAFSSLKNKEQLGTLLELVQIPIDLEQWAVDRKRIFDERTTVNRNATEVQGQIKGFPELPEDLPAEEVSAATILQEQRAAQAVIDENNVERGRLGQFKDAHGYHVCTVQGLEEDIKTLEARLVDARNRLKAAQEEVDVARTVYYEQVSLTEALKDPDLSVFDQRITEVESTNRMVRAKAQKAELESKLALIQRRSKLLTERLTAKDAEKVDALKAVKMPIEGLTFDDNGLFYNSVPFNQCSSGERLKVSTAMGMALNPKLKVMFIRDGSLLDTKHRAILHQMALDNDYQLWMEVTDDTGKVGIYFEDGEIVEPKQS